MRRLTYIAPYDHFLEDFRKVVAIEPRVKVDLTIVTAADANYFLPAQLLWLSVASSHECRFVWCDLGLTQRQREWCLENGVELLSVPARPHTEDTHGWQTWNKPYYLSAACAQRVLWLDADTLVVGPLDWLDEAISYRPFTVHCFAATMLSGDYKLGIRSLGNRPQLYDHFPVPRRMTRDRPNAGVVGLDVQRDYDLLYSWQWMVQQAADDPEVADWLRYWDQGALQWALEKNDLLGCVTHELRFNDPVSIQPGRLRREKFLSALETRSPQSCILHFPAGNKPQLDGEE